MVRKLAIDAPICDLPDWSKPPFCDSFAIVLVNVENGEATAFTEPRQIPAEDAGPAWSPDGSKIAFTRWTGCDTEDCYTPEIWTVNADGSQPSFLGVYGGGVNWSPDGTRIIFDNTGELFVMNADGAGVTNIAQQDKSRRILSSSWQPLVIGCADSISPASQSFDSDGGTGSFEVTASSDCSWTAISYASWVVVTSMNGSGNGSVVYSAAANSSTSSRTAGLIVTGRGINITQSGVPVRIASASVSGKRLFVFGENFDPGAVILLNGEEQKTMSDDQNSKTALIAKKPGKKVKIGDKLHVRNPNGSMSAEFTFTGS